MACKNIKILHCQTQTVDKVRARAQDSNLQGQLQTDTV